MLMLDVMERAVLQDARDLLADPDHWCQGTEALDAAGVPVNPHDEWAVKWCAYGALCRATLRAALALSDALPHFGAALGTKAHELYGDDLRFRMIVDCLDKNSIHNTVAVNDRLGYDALMTLFDKVLADETVEP